MEEKAAKIKEWVMLKLSEVKTMLQQSEKSSLVLSMSGKRRTGKEDVVMNV